MTQTVETAVWIRPRSVIPGRQRWDVRVCLDQPRVAGLIEGALLECPGIGAAQANPVTGRVLVLHDGSVNSEDVGELVRWAASRATVSAELMPPTFSSPVPGSEVTGVQKPIRFVRLVAVVCGGAVAIALAGTVLRTPLVRFEAVVLATVIVIRRAWKRSSRSRQTSTNERSIRHPVLQMIGSHRREYYRATVLSATAQTLYMLPAAIVGVVIAVFISGPLSFLFGLGLVTKASQVFFLLAVAGVIAVAFTLVSYRAIMKWRQLAQSVKREWRTEMYAYVQRAELGYLEGERTTRLARVLTDDIDQFTRFLAGPAGYLVRISTTLVLLVPVFIIGVPSIAWIAFLPVPVIAWASFFYQEKITANFVAAGEKESLLNSQLLNNLEASATIKSFGTEGFEIDRIQRLTDTGCDENLTIDRRSTLYSQLVLGCAISALLGLYLAGGLEVLGGTMSLEGFNTLVALPPILSFQLPGLGEAVEQYQRTVGALERVEALRSLPAEDDHTGRPLDLPAVEGELALDRVTFAYPGRPSVLQDVSLRFKARRTTGIVGVTGSGKTTIAKLLLRLQDVGSGQVMLDGVDVRELRLRDLRAAIGFVGQEAFLFDGTVRDNIAYGSFDADEERVLAAARLAEADVFIETLPKRYDTPVGERGITLSGGQKQRISLARAILKGAPILILDEATSAVDNETEAAIQHALVDFAQDRTMVIIAHRLSTIRHADWIYVIGEGGVVVEQGTHSDLLDRGGIYTTLWRLQIGEIT